MSDRDFSLPFGLWSPVQEALISRQRWNQGRTSFVTNGANEIDRKAALTMLGPKSRGDFVRLLANAPTHFWVQGLTGRGVESDRPRIDFVMTFDRAQ